MGTGVGTMRPISEEPWHAEVVPKPKRLARLAEAIEAAAARRKGKRPPNNPYEWAMILAPVPAAAMLAATFHSMAASAWSPAAGWGPALGLASCVLTLPCIPLVVAWARWRLRQPYPKARRAIAGSSLGLAAQIFSTMMVTLAAVSIQDSARFAKDETFHWVELTQDGTGIAIATDIKRGTERKFAKLLSENAGVRTVHLSSHGGLGQEAIDIANLIRKKGLTTIAIGPCYSACTIIHAAGRTRLLADNGAKLGYHSASYMIAGSVRPYTGTGGSEVYVASGFSRDFIARADTTPHSEIWKPDLDTLLGAGVVHGIVERDDVLGLIWLLRRDGATPDWYLDTAWTRRPMRLAPGHASTLRRWSGSAQDAARNDRRASHFRRAYLGRVLSAGLSHPEAPDHAVRKAGAFLLSGMQAVRNEAAPDKEIECTRMGAGADFARAEQKAPNPPGSTSDPSDPYGALFVGALSGLPAGWDAKAAPLPRVDDPLIWIDPLPKATETCDALIRWYADAVDHGNPDGLSRLRDRFDAIARGGRTVEATAR